MSEQYFLVRRLGLGKEVVSLSLVVMEVSRGGGMRYRDNEDRVLVCKYLEKRILKGCYV